MGHGVRKENISRFSDAYTWRGVGGTWKRVESFPLIWAGEQVWDKLMVWRGRGHAGSQLPRGGGGEYQLRRNSWFPAETKKIAFSEFRKHFGLKWKDDFDASILDFICRVLDVCAVAQVV